MHRREERPIRLRFPLLSDCFPLPGISVELSSFLLAGERSLDLTGILFSTKNGYFPVPVLSLGRPSGCRETL